MEIIVHKHFVLQPPNDEYKKYSIPIWEVEICSDILNLPEFEDSLQNIDNYIISPGHNSQYRYQYNGSGPAEDLVLSIQKHHVLDIITQCVEFGARFPRPLTEYQSNKTSIFAKILKDEPRFQMGPHIDNNHVMAQLIVNLLQDNQTSTDFYFANNLRMVYSAPRQKNHGILFLNTPGAIHGIKNVTNTRWILYGGILI